MFKKQRDVFSPTRLIRFSLLLILFFLFPSRAAIGANSLALTSRYTWVDISDRLPGTGAIMTNIQITGNNFWIPTMNSGIYVSHDGGDSFYSAPALAVYGIFFQPDALRGYSVGGGKVYRTTDGGVAWGNSSIQADLNDVYFANDNIGYVAGNIVYRTADGGNNWTKKTNPASYTDISSISFPDPSHPDIGYAAVFEKDPSLYKTVNGGDTWQAVDLGGIIGGLNSIEFTSPNSGWAVGNAGKIFHYNGSGWTPQTSNVITTLNDVSFSANNNQGCAVGNSGVIVCTFDGGKNWAQEKLDSVIDALMGVEITSDGHVYVVGYGKTFLQGSFIPGNNKLFIPLILK
jgi:photosystem II stability/assembly factor-like uncharacterized protein